MFKGFRFEEATCQNEIHNTKAFDPRNHLDQKKFWKIWKHLQKHFSQKKILQKITGQIKRNGLPVGFTLRYTRF
jgi:hypothetical protein